MKRTISAHRVAGASALAALLLSPFVARAAGPNAIQYSSGCLDHALPANDDGSTGAVILPFEVNLYNQHYNTIYINNNGNVTFDGPLSIYTPFPLRTTHHRIIAPFFADVDTRGTGSGVVHYGTTTYDGRTAFCVVWASSDSAGVGYFVYGTDKLNNFQLLLVDAHDPSLPPDDDSYRAPGDFDIVFNYDQIQWEAGSASGGVGGLGGSTARVGYSDGSTDATKSHERDGSGIPGSFLDNNSLTGLIHASQGTMVQLGRYIYPVKNSQPPGNSGISGFILGPNDTPLVGAPVQICTTVQPEACHWFGTTNASGGYTASGLANGTQYRITAFPPAGANWIPQTRIITTPLLNSLAGVNLALEIPTPPPAGTNISPASIGADGVPVIFWHDQTTLTVPGCASGRANFEVKVGNSTFTSGTMTLGDNGNFAAVIPPFYPNHGAGTVLVQTQCDVTTSSLSFPIYIDPSGRVRTVGGAPVVGATVTLLRTESSPLGLFSVVPDGSAIMSPMNRENPSITDEEGHFGWDVITGYYKVRAEKAGCHDPNDPSRPYVESRVMRIPPPVLDLDLRLECGTGAVGDDEPPRLDAPGDLVIEATSTTGATVSFTTTAIDDVDGAVPVLCTEPSGDSFPIGTTVVHCYALDGSDNLDYGSFVVTVQDTSAPVLTVPGPLAVSPEGPWGATFGFTAIALDIVDGPSLATCSPAPGSTLPVGTTTVTCSATDESGNTATASFDVTVPGWVDEDDDAVYDGIDNCPDRANPGQADDDGDGIGNACDPVCLTIQRGTFGAVADAYIGVGERGYSSGAYPYVYTGLASSGEKMSLLSFDLSAIPAEATVEQASLSVSAQSSTVTGTINVHAVTAPWSESTVSYNNFGNSFGSRVEASFTVATGAVGPQACDVTALVQDWADGSSANHGLLLRELGSTKHTFRASEHATVAERPKLRVCYTTP